VRNVDGSAVRRLLAAVSVATLIALSSRAAAAEVLPDSVLDAALASAKELHRQAVPTLSGQPYYKLGMDNSDGPGGFIDRTSFDYGALVNGADVLIVPMDSGGSGGVFTTLLFTSVRTHPLFVGPINSDTGHLDVHLARGQILVVTPIYAKTDPNCCPSGHHFVRYALEDGKLVKVEEGQYR